MIRPTKRLEALQISARPASIACRADELGSSRQTRHSFSRALTRYLADNGGKVTRRVWELDAEGRGTAVYRVEVADHVLEAVIFSQVIDEQTRTDRVIAEDWDATIALVDGEASFEVIDGLSGHVTKQEDGRAEDTSLIWGRANRSERFFNYVADRLANGQQPEVDAVSDAAYIMRSTAFYGNGKWGLRDFDGIEEAHPLSMPYRAQMLCAWLFREFSADLVEHVAAARGSAAVPLDPAWRRYLGLGNATGLGMVPYVIRHPQVMDAWVAMRELPLASALHQTWAADGPQWDRVRSLLARAQQYFAAKKSFSTDPYPSGPELAAELEMVVGWAREFAETRAMDGVSTSEPGARLHELAEQVSLELRQIVDSVLVEVDSSLDADIAAVMRCVDRTHLQPQMSVEELRALIDEHYAWALSIDFALEAETAKFWFYSENNQEPRRGERGKDKGEITEHPVGIARDVSALRESLADVDPTMTVGEFLIAHNEHWGIVERVQSVADLPYSEARVNPLAADFLPLDLQRFQLACYGMENYNPQSTDWLRVTLFEGAPTVADIHAGSNVDDWLFLPRPQEMV
jgi:hypothetical protein